MWQSIKYVCKQMQAYRRRVQHRIRYVCKRTEDMSSVRNRIGIWQSIEYVCKRKEDMSSVASSMCPSIRSRFDAYDQVCASSMCASPPHTFILDFRDVGKNKSDLEQSRGSLDLAARPYELPVRLKVYR